jgi:hypothetical protein
MKRAAFATLSLMFVSTFALAGKEEREYLNSEVTPAVKAAEAKFKASCGCNVKVTVNDSSSKSKDDLQLARLLVNGVADGAGTYCSDAASKKAICQMKSLDVTKSANMEFTFKGGKGVAAHNGISYPSWELMTKELDK